MLLNYNIQKCLCVLKDNNKLSIKEKYINFMDVLEDYYYKEMQVIGLIEMVDF